MPHALIICNGDVPEAATLAALARGAARVIAADGGANRALAAGVAPHAVVGDLDSISPETRGRLPDARIVHVPDQDACDLEKALDFAIAEGFSAVTVTGIEGRRVDFTLSNFSVLWRYAGRLRLSLAGEGWRGEVLDASARFSAPVGATVSLVPFGDCAGLTLEGLEYPLRDAPLCVGQTGVSNRVVRSPFTVELSRGRLILIALTDALARA